MVIERIKNHFDINCDASKMAMSIYNESEGNLFEYIKTKNITHYQRLASYGLEKDIQHCLTENTAPVLPVYKEGKLIRANQNV